MGGPNASTPKRSVDPASDIASSDRRKKSEVLDTNRPNREASQSSLPAHSGPYPLNRPRNGPIQEAALGLWLSGVDQRGELHQDPEDNYEPALLVELSVDASLEPKWSRSYRNGSCSRE